MYGISSSEMHRGGWSCITFDYKLVIYDEEGKEIGRIKIKTKQKNEKIEKGLEDRDKV